MIIREATPNYHGFEKVKKDQRKILTLKKGAEARSSSFRKVIEELIWRSVCLLVADLRDKADRWLGVLLLEKFFQGLIVNFGIVSGIHGDFLDDDDAVEVKLFQLRFELRHT